jgi:hypothetical protein
LKGDSDQSNAADLSGDPRWKRVLERPFRCLSCDNEHHGLFHLVAAAPVFWRSQHVPLRNEDVYDFKNFLSEDFCVMDGAQFYVRCVLELPIKGTATDKMSFGVWSTLSKANFVRYYDTFNGGHQSELGPMFGWFSNELPGFEGSADLKCYIVPRDERLRPLIEFESTDHPLSIAYWNGVTFEQVLDIYAAAGHDIRASLAQADP